MKNILKILTPADIVLILILLIISGVMLGRMKADLTDAKIEIHFHNTLLGTYSLQEAQVIELEEGIQVEIAKNKVRIKQNTCEHQYCVQQGWSDGLPIICVPNEIIIKFISKKEEMLITR